MNNIVLGDARVVEVERRCLGRMSSDCCRCRFPKILDVLYTSREYAMVCVGLWSVDTLQPSSSPHFRGLGLACGVSAPESYYERHPAMCLCRSIYLFQAHQQQQNSAFAAFSTQAAPRRLFRFIYLCQCQRNASVVRLFSPKL